MMSNEYPFSENYRIAGEDWADKEAAAQLLEDSKSAVMAQRQTMLGDIPVNRAEQLVKASEWWRTHVQTIVEARRVANQAKIKVEYLKMRFHEHQSREANGRAEMRFLGGDT